MNPAFTHQITIIASAKHRNVANLSSADKQMHVYSSLCVKEDTNTFKSCKGKYYKKDTRLNTYDHARYAVHNFSLYLTLIIAF